MKASSTVPTGFIPHVSKPAALSIAHARICSNVVSIFEEMTILFADSSYLKTTSFLKHIQKTDPLSLQLCLLVYVYPFNCYIHQGYPTYDRSRQVKHMHVCVYVNTTHDAYMHMCTCIDNQTHMYIYIYTCIKLLRVHVFESYPCYNWAAVAFPDDWRHWALGPRYVRSPLSPTMIP